MPKPLTVWLTKDCSQPGSSVHGFSRQAYWSGLPFIHPAIQKYLRRIYYALRTEPGNIFPEKETLIFREGEPMPDMNRPPYCPMTSSAVAQFKKGDGWWRLVADYTKPHKHNMVMVANGLRTALEFLVISYDRESREKTIKRMQEHQQYRADLLAFALSKDDLQGLIDFTMRRLLDLAECDYITAQTHVH